VPVRIPKRTQSDDHETAGRLHKRPAPPPRTAQSAAMSTAHANGPMRLTFLVGQLDRVVSRRLTEALAVHGRTLSQFTALLVLSARGR
jgi:hypothetical protein